MAQRGSKGHSKTCQAVWHFPHLRVRVASGSRSQLQPDSGLGRPGSVQDARSASSQGSGLRAPRFSTTVPKLTTERSFTQVSGTAEKIHCWFCNQLSFPQRSPIRGIVPYSECHSSRAHCTPLPFPGMPAATREPIRTSRERGGA